MHNAERNKWMNWLNPFYYLGIDKKKPHKYLSKNYGIFWSIEGIAFFPPEIPKFKIEGSQELWMEIQLEAEDYLKLSK